MRLDGPDGWAARNVLEALAANPSTPVEVTVLRATRTRLFKPSFGLSEAVEVAFHGMDRTVYTSMILDGKSTGPYPRLRRAVEMTHDDEEVAARAFMDALVMDLIAAYAIAQPAVRVELDLRQRACSEYAQTL